MSKKQSTAVVPAPKQVPAIRRNTDVVPDFSLYDGEKHFTDRDDVRQYLPDILGRALARTWIDPEFRNSFENDPSGSLAQHGVFMPETMSIEFQRKSADRPRIVVFEQRPNSKFKARVLYLQLVMMAGR